MVGKKEERLFTKTIRLIFLYWPVFVAFGILLAGLGFIYLRYASPVYQATASIIIKDEKKGNEDSKLMESLNLIADKKIIENEIEVLHARPIMEHVVKQLHLNTPIYREGRIKSVLAYKEAPLQIELQSPEKLKLDVKKIYLNYTPGNHYVLLNQQLAVPLNVWAKTKYGILKFTPNPNFIPNGIRDPYYFHLLTTDRVVQKMQAALKVTATNKLSSIINLQYNDAKPALAKDILNEIIYAYKNGAEIEKNTLAKNTLRFIDDRLAIVRGDLDLIERKIRLYKGNQDAVDIGTQGQLYLQNVSANDKRLSELDMQLSVMNELERKVKVSDVNIGILPASLGVVDPTLSSLVNSLNVSELEQEKLKNTVAVNNPILIALNDQISNTKQKITENILSYKKSVEASKQQLNANNKDYNKLLQDIPQKEQMLLEISRDNKIKSDIYSFLLQKREESELAYASNLTDSQIVNDAFASNEPVSPNKMILLGSLLLGLFILPISTIGARERWSKSVLYRDDIEALTDIPIMGEIGFNKEKVPFLLEKGETGALLDEFRRLRYTLLSTNQNKPHRKIMVSSSITGEGKSYIASNLAKSFAIAGKKVVLVDFDLHNSTLNDNFEIGHNVGVSDFLAGEASLDQIIHNVDGYSAMRFISSGTRRNDPFGLLESDQTQVLMDFLDKEFEIIIMDTPPVVQVTDAYVLTRFCDTTLFIVKHGYSPKRVVKILELNNESQLLKDPAIVFNGVKARGFLKNSYGYGYGYSMPYGEKTAG